MPTALPPSSDFTGSGVTEGGFKSSISALRVYLAELLGTTGSTATALATLGSPLSSYVVKSGAYTAVAGDKGKTFDCTGTWTFGLLAAATAGDGFTLAIRNGGTGVITVDPNLSETIDGGATLTINAGESLILYCMGTAWISIGKSSGVPSGFYGAYGGGTVPAGWLLCDGSAVSRATYASLFSAIGTTHGVGDGSSTFNLPDSRGRTVIGRDDMGGSAANRITAAVCGITGTTLGAAGGAQSITLTTSQLPSHSHSMGIGAGTSGGSATNNFYEVSFYDGSTYRGATSVENTGAAGSGTAHSNVQPSLVANVIIKT